MNSISSLLLKHKNHRIYVFLSNDHIGKLFMKNAEQEGFTFSDGVKPTARCYDSIIVVNKDMTINYVGFVGRIAFQSCKKIGNKKLIRIDYRQFLEL